tara:strand:- start:6961 stop:7083 length:123 start_codon:yes stop_codon:yes gene_type:complete
VKKLGRILKNYQSFLKSLLKKRKNKKDNDNDDDPFIYPLF